MWVGVPEESGEGRRGVLVKRRRGIAPPGDSKKWKASGSKGRSPVEEWVGVGVVGVPVESGRDVTPPEDTSRRWRAAARDGCL